MYQKLSHVFYLMHDAIAAVNTSALHEEIYCCDGKRKKWK